MPLPPRWPTGPFPVRRGGRPPSQHPRRHYPAEPQPRALAGRTKRWSPTVWLGAVAAAFLLLNFEAVWIAFLYVVAWGYLLFLAWVVLALTALWGVHALGRWLQRRDARRVPHQET